MKRRKFITITGAGIAGSALLNAAPAYIQGTPVRLTFGHGPDDSGTIQSVIDQFNQRYKGQIQVTWKVMDRLSNNQHRRLVSDFAVESGEMEVFSSDVPWTAEFATRKWIKEITKAFYRDYTPEDFLTSTLKSTYYKYKMWGVPWYTDIGLLFYRRDLLEKNGYSAPPKTLAELTSMAKRVRSNSGVKHGFVFQGADYEGGVANALEYIWNAGGRVLTGNISVAGEFGMKVTDPNVITVNSKNSADGLMSARNLIKQGVTPRAVINYTELKSWNDFVRGDAVFMRNWPYAFGNLGNPDLNMLEREQVGVAPMPTLSDSGESYSCQGGWNLMINRFTSERKQEAAWKFVRYLTAPEQQKTMALKGGFLPTFKALYDDPEILRQIPAIREGRSILENARVRPITPFYQIMAPRISRGFNRVLRGETSGSAAVAKLEKELRIVLRKFR